MIKMFNGENIDLISNLTIFSLQSLTDGDYSYLSSQSIRVAPKEYNVLGVYLDATENGRRNLYRIFASTGPVEWVIRGDERFIRKGRLKAPISIEQKGSLLEFSFTIIEHQRGALSERALSVQSNNKSVHEISIDYQGDLPYRPTLRIVQSEAPSVELVQNYDFSNGKANWTYQATGGTGSFAVISGVGRITKTSSQGSPRIYNRMLSFPKNILHEVKMRYRVSQTQGIKVFIELETPDGQYPIITQLHTNSVAGEWVDFSMNALSNLEGDAYLFIENVGAANCVVEIEYISVRKATSGSLSSVNVNDEALISNLLYKGEIYLDFEQMEMKMGSTSLLRNFSGGAPSISREHNTLKVATNVPTNVHVEYKERVY